MLYDHEREHTILCHEKRAKEIEIEIDTQNREIEDFFNDIDITPQQIQQYLANEHHFSQKNWDEIQQLQEEQEQKTTSLIDQIHRPKKPSQTTTSFNPNWIPIP